MTARAWKDIRPGWPEIIIQLNEYDPQTHKIEIIEWIEKNIQKVERHCVYTWTENKVRIKFRYERDYIMCRLRW
jgi:hypothetical protein